MRHLYVGVYGVSSDGVLAIPTIRVKGPLIESGADPSGDPASQTELTVWAQIMASIGDLTTLNIQAKGSLVAAVNELFSLGNPGYSGDVSFAKTTEITLLASAWNGTISPFFQVINLDDVDINSIVNLQLSVDQLEELKDKDMAFTTENDSGVVTVYAIGDKPTEDYTIQATILEVVT